MNLQKEFAKAKQLFDSDPNTNNANALYLAKEKLELLYEEKLQGIIICPKWELGSNNTCPNGNWALITLVVTGTGF